MAMNMIEVANRIIQQNEPEDPFYVCDLREITRKHYEWTRYLPRVRPFYAVKCNDTKILLKTLASLGCGFDCASKAEVEKVVELGVSPSTDVVYANTVKPISHIEAASSLGVEMVTVDSEMELMKIKKHMPGAKILIRLLSEAKEAGYPLGRKFGVPLNECIELLQVAKSLSFNVIGICFHVGSECKELTAYSRAISKTKVLFDYAKNELGLNLHLLDIGGGFPGHDSSTFIKLADTINSALENYFPERNVEIIAEPGRYFPTTAFTLFAQIHSKRVVKDEDGRLRETMYFINDGIYGSFNVLLFDKKKSRPGVVSGTESRPELFKSSIWGPTCDGRDQLYEGELLPNLDVGDWLQFSNMGAYSIVGAGHFNGFSIPKLYAVTEPKSLNRNVGA